MRTRDQHPVDLVRALENPVDARIAVHLLDPILLDEAVAAVDLHGLIHHEVQHFRAEDLVDGALDRVLRDRLRGLHARIRPRDVDGLEDRVEEPSSAIDHALQRVNLRVHPRELALNERELREFLAKLLPLIRVLRRRLERDLGPADAPAPSLKRPMLRMLNAI